MPGDCAQCWLYLSEGQLAMRVRHQPRLALQRARGLPSLQLELRIGFELPGGDVSCHLRLHSSWRTLPPPARNLRLSEGHMHLLRRHGGPSAPRRREHRGQLELLWLHAGVPEPASRYRYAVHGRRAQVRLRILLRGHRARLHGWSLARRLPVVPTGKLTTSIERL